MIASDAEADEVLEALMTHFTGMLTPWEYDFCVSLGDQREHGKGLTETQRQKLGEIWDGFESGRRQRPT